MKLVCHGATLEMHGTCSSSHCVSTGLLVSGVAPTTVFVTQTRIVVDFPNTPYLGIWMKPGADFLCIEPWHGIADPQGYADDFMRKPGVFQVPAGASKELLTSITLNA